MNACAIMVAMTLKNADSNASFSSLSAALRVIKAWDLIFM